ncbi:MAG TPA: M48 family metallopeptidase [Chitinispirillaceae bacterium]|nr:M48 family metallopeptidase [Chitinispirillaceae bacterium]
MKKTFSLLSLGLFLFIQCSPVPITGRHQINLIPQSQMLALSFQSYDQFIKEHKIIKETKDAQQVAMVGKSIQQAVEQYFKMQKKSDLLNGYEWEFNLVKDSTINAFAMPGGKTAVLTGILPVTQNVNGLAVVLGHEIAHAVARHGNERMSQLLLVQLGGMALSEALSEQPELTQELALIAFGVGTQVGVLLPYSRIQESEADRLGLIFMAMAGYDPHEAVNFWERMEKQGGPKIPEFLSTHPAAENRIENIKKLIPEAMKYYRNDKKPES